MLVLFFFKQKTADEWRISDWSSDVCSSDLRCSLKSRVTSVSASSGGWPSTCLLTARKTELSWDRGDRSGGSRTRSICCRGTARGNSDRKSVESGKSVSVSVDFGGRRIIKKKQQTYIRTYKTSHITTT